MCQSLSECYFDGSQKLIAVSLNCPCHNLLGWQTKVDISDLSTTIMTSYMTLLHLRIGNPSTINISTRVSGAFRIYY